MLQQVLLRLPYAQVPYEGFGKATDQDVDAGESGLRFEVRPDMHHRVLGRQVAERELGVVEAVVRGDVAGHGFGDASVDEHLLAVGHELVGAEIAADGDLGAPDGGSGGGEVGAVAFDERDAVGEGLQLGCQFGLVAAEAADRGVGCSEDRLRDEGP